MKSIFKKNQLMITALALMIAIAGYLQFAGTNLEEENYLPVTGDAVTSEALEGVDVENYTVDEITGEIVTDDMTALMDLSEEDLEAAGGMNITEATDISSLDSEVDVVMEDYLDEDMEVAVETPEEGEIPGEAVFTGADTVAGLSDARLLREQVRAKNKETLLEIINSSTLSDAQKQSASDSLVELTYIAEKEMGAEILLQSKGFNDVVVSMNEGYVDVVVNALSLTDAQRAQIEDIVKRKTGVMAENIVISTVVQ